MANIFVGVDLTNATLQNSIPGVLGCPETKTIFRAGNNEIQEIRSSFSRCVLVENGEEKTILYSATSSKVLDFLPEIDLGNFGVVDYVDETATYYPYLTKAANLKLYGFTEESHREEISRIRKGETLPEASLEADVFLRY